MPDLNPYPGDTDWPADFQGSRLTGKFIDVLGTPCVGRITFTPSPPAILDVAFKTIIMPAIRSVTLDEFGAFDILLPATDDPDLNPTGWTYTVDELIPGGRSYSITAPINETHDLSELAPVPDNNGVYITRGETGPEGPGGPAGLTGEQGPPGNDAAVTLFDEGVAVANRAGINFVGSTVALSDDSANGRTIVTITSPTTPATGLTKSTVAAGLPTLVGRIAGDLHYNDTTDVEHVVTGAVGTVVADTFDRANSASLGTSSSGAAWTPVSSTGPAISGNKAVTGSATASTVELGTGHHTGSLDWTPAATLDAVNVYIKATTALADFYNVQYSISGSNIYWALQTPEGTASSTVVGVPYVAGHVYTVSIYSTDALFYATITDATTGATETRSSTTGVTASTGTLAGFKLTGNAANAADNVNLIALGTLAWVPLVPTSPSNGLTKSTVGAVLPAFTGRNVGDLHYNATTGLEHVLTGVVAAGYVSESFDGSASTVLNGRTTTTGSKAWVADSEIILDGSGRAGASFVGGGYAKKARLDFGSSAQDVTAFFVPDPSYSNFQLSLGATAINLGGGTQTGGLQFGTGALSGAPGATVTPTMTLTNVGNGNATLFSGAVSINLANQLKVRLVRTAGGVVTLYVNDVQLYTGSPTINTLGNLCGFWLLGSTSTPKIESFEVGDQGTLAWSPTTTLTALGYVAPTVGSIGAAKSTVGAGLPPFLGHAAGDFHFDTTVLREYVLTGAQGTGYYDTFNRADAVTLGTSASGSAWSGTDHPRIVGNKVYARTAVAASNVNIDLGHADQTISMEVTLSDDANKTFPVVWVRLNAGYTEGYKGVLNNASGNNSALRVSIQRNSGDVVGPVNLTGLTWVPGRIYRIDLTAVGALVTFVVTDTTTGVSDRITYTDGTPLTGTRSGFGFLTGRNDLLGDTVDNVSSAAVGTLAWNLTSPTREVVFTNAAAGATETISEPDTASLSYLTLDANCTLTFPTAVAGKSFTLVLKQDGTGSRTVTWPGTVQWSSGTAPTLTTTAAKRDVFTFMCADGTNWLGFMAGLNF